MSDSKYVVVLIAFYISVFSILTLKTQALNSDYFSELGFSAVQSSNSTLVLNVKPVLQKLDTIITENGSITLMPFIKGASLAEAKPGSPSTIILKGNVAIPTDGKFRIRSFSYTKVKSYSFKIAPYPELKPIKDIWTEYYTDKNDDYLYHSGLSAHPQITLLYAGIARNVNVAELKIDVAWFNPIMQTTSVAQEIQIEIEFDQSNNTQMSQPYNDLMPPVINSSVINDFIISPNDNTINLKKGVNDDALVLSSGNWIKVAINKEGLYRIEASALSSLGFTITKDLIPTLKIFGNGGVNLSEKVLDAALNKMNEQELIVNTTSNGDLESIVFYGAPTQGFKYENDEFVSWYNYYSDRNYYLLTWGGAPGKRSQPLQSPNDEATIKPLNYKEMLFFKEEFICAIIGGSGKTWLGGSIFPRSFSNILPNLDRTQDIAYKINVAHRASGNGSFSIAESGKNILIINIPITTDTKYQDAIRRIGSVSIPASSLPGDNRSTLNITYDNPKMAGATPFFNSYEIHYNRAFIPVNNQISFWSEPAFEGITEFSVNGFNGTPIGFDVTDQANPKQIANIAVTGGMFIFKNELTANNPKRFFISSVYEKPELSITNFAGLRDDIANAELILITHKNFLNSAEKYKEYRSNHKIHIVDIADIFTEFNAGLPDPTTVRDYIAFTMQNWETKPKHVLLWGDGHYDYKNLSTKSPNYITTFQSIEKSDSFMATSSYTSDDFFGFVVGDDRFIDLSISRVPINSDNDGLWVVEKIKYYEQFSSIDEWRTNLIMLADDSPTSGGSGDGSTHTRQSESLSNDIVPDFMFNRKVYLPEYPSENIPNGRRKPRVSEELLSLINNSGGLTVNFVGHGNPRVWTHEEVFDRDKHISQLKNLNKLFFNTAATCDFARWDMPETSSGAEELFLAKTGGAIGVFSSTRVVYSYDNAQINETFHSLLFSRNPIDKRYPNLGTLMYQVKQIRANSNDTKYNLLGDPLLTLHIPDNIVRIEEINSVKINSINDIVPIKAMSKVTLKASVINPIDSSVITDFNGMANVSFLDADYNIRVTDIDGTIHNIRKYGGALNRGSFPVENGTMEVSFYLPEDISFVDAPGRIYFYAYDNNRRTAAGISRNFKIDGIESLTSVVDSPVINIYLDSVTFRPGDIVSNNPLLIVRVRDDYGVNTSGSGIGHRLEAWIDNNPISIDLTYNTFISADDPKTIEARHVLTDLSPGMHSVKVRGWNVFNKYAVANTNFRILSGDEGAMIWDLTCFPNPFYEDITLQFRHNLNRPFEAKLKIYNSEGRQVRVTNQTISSVHTSTIAWDGTTDEGTVAAQGLYYLMLEIYTHKGNASGATGAAFVK